MNRPISTYNHTSHTSMSNFIRSYGLTKTIWDQNVFPRLPEPAAYARNKYGIKFPIWTVDTVEAVFVGALPEIEPKLAKLQTYRIAAEERKQAKLARMAAEEATRREGWRKNRSKRVDRNVSVLIDVAQGIQSDVVFLDLEFDSLAARSAIEICAVRCYPDRAPAVLQEVLSPEKTGDDFFCGLTKEDVAGARRFSDVAYELGLLLAGATHIVMAHPGALDYDFLVRQGILLNTSRIVDITLPHAGGKRPSLWKLCELADHTASGDVLAMVTLYLKSHLFPNLHLDNGYASDYTVERPLLQRVHGAFQDSSENLERVEEYLLVCRGRDIVKSAAAEWWRGKLKEWKILTHEQERRRKKLERKRRRKIARKARGRVLTAPAICPPVS